MSNATHNKQSAVALQDGERVIERDITGAVKWYNEQKGYGFLKCDDGREIYVHRTGLNTTGFAPLQENQFVKFDIADGRRGLKAINVELQ